MFVFVLFSVNTESNISSTNVWSDDGNNTEKSEDIVKTPAPDNVPMEISQKSKDLLRSSSSKTICNDDVEKYINDNTSSIARLSIESTADVNKQKDDETKIPPPKSPFFLKQLDLSDDIINFGPKSSETVAGKTKSKKSIGSPLQRKIRGFSTLSSNRSVKLLFIFIITL